MANIDEYLSHNNPNKRLIDHINGVVGGVKRRTDSKIAELSAIFHDVGKMNPYFQEKLKTGKTKGYSKHSYLSGYIFLCYLKENYKHVIDYLNGDENLISAVLALITHHHLNLPDFPKILDDSEKDKLRSFLTEALHLPVSEYLAKYFPKATFDINIPYKDNLLSDIPTQICLRTQKLEKDPLNFFLTTQFSFASLIAADKEDASNYISTSDLRDFCKVFNSYLENYISNFRNDTEINKIRTEIREEAKSNIKSLLDKSYRIFSLTAPTGSGKTVILLSLAGEILKRKGDYRIIYGLPFLSITEQVESICNEIFKENNKNIVRIDSKSENKLFEIYQKELDGNSQANKKIINAQFADDIFDHPFIITTFVKIFETLLSNKNSTLLKLPNFSRAIFLIDEIQALPPRLYGFFVALLDIFCKKYDSYAIISTATMPCFQLPSNNKHDLTQFFGSYTVPPELVSLNYFSRKVFNRYKMKIISEKIEVDRLASLIVENDSSALVILNTIEDTKSLFSKLCELKSKFKLILLNTHFTPLDRKKKIRVAKWYLKKKAKVVLISTQLIEAGVDIDFPLVYRDFAPIPNLIQSAGRGNRNGLIKEGARIVIFRLAKDDCERASLIYKGMDRDILSFSKILFQLSEIDESSLLKVQKKYFQFTQQNLIFGQHNGIDMIGEIKNMAFEKVGQFKLINEKEYGEEIRYYIPRNNNDNEFEKLERLYEELQNIIYSDFDKKKVKWIEIENQLKKMSDRIVQVRIKSTDAKPVADKDPCFQIYKLSTGYSSTRGIELSNINQIL
ncbi:CRISPR-associated helicase Cas3' [Thermosipho sp. (in: thermotogales)]|uniref:CRISPR-associated helicase Cas3' n=1 Tax=Thermosipho sp. (in: thermotogales) TaxID=1968895 RepID=UPI00257F2F3F|nr:CRISPR-associated helicase Cas3' [Thermosipho sp. (in: thermotogales)]MBZ4651116.1 CRISPR-associated domain protein [Thermosipho sp. (in: thermotogales)]